MILCTSIICSALRWLSLTDPDAKMARCGMVVSDGRTDLTLATPECCLRRKYVTPTWMLHGPAHDQHYFGSIVAAQHWGSEENGDIVVIAEALCRANSDACGGLRVGLLLTLVDRCLHNVPWLILK